MSEKDCIRLLKQLDPEDRAAFNDYYRMATENDLLSPEDAFVDAAESMLDLVLADRNELAAEIVEKGGYLQTLTLEQLLNPASYESALTGAAADIGKMDASDFDALLEDAAPAPTKDVPVPKADQEPAPRPVPKGKKVLTEQDADRFVRDRKGKKLGKALAHDLRAVAKAAGIERTSKMNKADLVESLRTWYDDKKLAALPTPMEGAELQAGIYSHANSGSYTIIQATTPNFWADDAGTRAMSQKGAMANAETIASHFGGSVQKKTTMYNGDKTEKGIHFQGWNDAAKFIKHYTGKTPVEPAATEGGYTKSIEFVEDQSPAASAEHAVGDKVKITQHGDQYTGIEPGEITEVETDPVDGLPLYTVKFNDPEGTQYEEIFFPENLQAIAPSKPSENATEAIKAAAEHGVKGIDEALTGLTDLFGGKGRFSSGLSFDEETYAKAKVHFKTALEEFVAAGQSLKEFVAFIVGKYGEGVKQYLKQFHQDIVDGNITVKGVNDVQSTTQDSAAAGTSGAEQTAQDDTGNVGADAATLSSEADNRPAEEAGIDKSRIGLPVDSPLDAGESSDPDVLGDTGEFQPESSTTGRSQTGRSATTGTKGVSTPAQGSQKTEADARATVKRQDLKPTTDTWVQSDPANIAESVPNLFPEQQDDVVFAETRLFDNGHRGVMFTNGTGTGKTYTGLGLVKRMIMQGKTNILVVVPGEKVASDWMISGAGMGINITKLTGIKDAGKGAVITSYANIAENDAIVKRDWDLVIHDEAHKLSENAQGKATNALNKSRAITGHPDGMWTYAESMEPKLMEHIRYLRAESKVISDPALKMGTLYGESKNKKTPDLRRLAKHLQLPKYVSATHEELIKAVEKFRKAIWLKIGGPEPMAQLESDPGALRNIIKARLQENDDTLQPILKEFNRRRTEIHNPNREALWQTKTPKRLDLTATPFAYDKSTDHAEGFLYEYDRTHNDDRGYNDPDARGFFMVEHFGYRMRTGKLTTPEADVDSGLMERQFNQWLKGEGALRGRILSVDHDYSREFIAIDDLVGTKIDEGWNAINDRARDKDNPLSSGYNQIAQEMQRLFNYHERVKLLEAIKAGHAIERARQHMALGRNVVIFHSRIQGGTQNPFMWIKHYADSSRNAPPMYDADGAGVIENKTKAIIQFADDFPELFELDINQVRPLDLFAQEFGDTMTTYNGTITNKAKVENPKKFQDDENEIRIIVLQDQGGKEGITLSDQTGAYQRVLMNLGLPMQPTQAIQIEGRIYRVGQESNAIFEYFNTGTSFERMTFASKISERASTAENLAMGELARSLKDSFIDAFETPSFGAPSVDQGVGGKEQDLATWNEISEFERAKTHYFGTLKTKGKRDQRQGLDYFATPEPLGFKMVEWADISANDAVLEPSAGHGAIARYFPDNTAITTVEPSGELISRLALRTPGNHRQINFEDLDVGGNKFSAIVMNPPFGAGGSTAIAHLHKAMHHLKNSGRVVALIPTGPAADKKFDNMFYGKEGELEQVREKFKRNRREGNSVAEETRRIEDLTKYHLRANISLPSVTFTRAGTAVRARVVVIDKIENDAASIVSQSPRDIQVESINELFDRIEDMQVPDRVEHAEDPNDYLVSEGIIISHDEANSVWRIKGKTFPHRAVIKRALGADVRFLKGAGHWGSKVDPVMPLYNEMTKPDVAPEPEVKVAPLWVKQDYQEYKSTDASINKTLNPVTIGIVEKNYGWESGTINADLGGGMHDNTVAHMEKIGVEHVVYDPFNRSDDYNERSVRKIRDGKADTVTINNTLNVVKESELRHQLLLEAENALKPGGKLYIQIYEGDKTGTGRNTKGDIWQENRKAADFLTEIQAVFPNAEIKYGLISAQKFITAVKPEVADTVKALFASRAGKLPNAPTSTLGGLEIKETKTKAGKAVWEVTGNTREHKDLLKALGGRWYNPKKAWSFYDGNPHDDIAAALNEDAAHLRGQPMAQKNGSNPRQVAAWIRTPRKRIHSRIKIEIVQKASDIGPSFPADILGTFADGVVYLVAGNIRSKQDAITTLEHEVVGHLGLEGLLGRRKFNELLADVTNMRVESMLNPGEHPIIDNVRADLRRRYVDKDGNYSLDPREEAREILAHIANMKPRIGPMREIYNKLVNWIKQAMVKLGFGDPSMVRIEQLLAEAVGYVSADVAAANKVNMVVAGLDPRGKLVVGELGDLHFNIVDRYATDEEFRDHEQYGDYGEWVMGFIDLAEPGKFLDREAAFNLIRENNPDYQMLDDELGELDSLDIVDIESTGMTIEQIQEKGEDYAYMRGPPSEEEERANRREKKLAEKFGMAPKKGFWQKINNLRLKVIVESMDALGARQYEGLFDGLIEIKRIEIESGTGLGIGDYENSAYVSARLATGVADMMTHIMHYGPLQWDEGISKGQYNYVNQQGELQKARGLLEIFGDLGTENLNDWLMWMGANRAKQLMKEGRERNLDADDIKLGITKAGLVGSERHQLFMRIKHEYNFMNKTMLDFAQVAGLIDPVKRAEWESGWYVPFYRMSEDEINAPRLKRGLSHQDANIRRLFGGDIPTSNLLENIITNWLKLTDASVKNHALRLMVDNFKDKADFDDMEYITHETMKFMKALVPRSEIRKRILQDRAFAKQVADYLGMDMDMEIDDPKTGGKRKVNMLDVINEVNTINAKGFEQLWALTEPRAKDVVKLKRNGKNEYWKINVPGLLRATTHISNQSSDSMAMRAGRGLKRLLTTGVTMSPDFMLRNFIRDAAHAWAINPDGFVFGVDSVKGFVKAMTPNQELYMAAMASGSSFQGGYVHATDPQASAQIIRRELEKRGLTDAAIHAHFASVLHSPAKLKATGLRLWQGYREVGDRIENANRLATLDRALKSGKSMAQAMFESKDLMDYSRRGNFGMLITLTDLIPFLNARMQGSDKLVRSGVSYKKILAKKMAWIVAWSILLAMWNEDEERYKELPDWEKDAYWHIFVGDEHFRIPKPFEIGIVAGTLPERAYHVWVAETQPSEKFLWSLRHNLMETLNVNLPQFMLPVVEVVSNRSFYFDQPIEGFTDQGKSSRERYNSFTSNTAMELGDTALAEWLDLSPKELQHLWVGYTGTMGAYGMKLADMAVRAVADPDDHPTREETQLYEYPVARSVYQGQRVKNTQWATDFYDRMEEVTELYGDMQSYRTQGKIDKALAYREEHKGKLKFKKTMEKVRQRFSMLRKRQDNVLRNKSLTPSQKYRQRQDIQIQINQVAKQIEAQTRSAWSD